MKNQPLSVRLIVCGILGLPLFWLGSGLHNWGGDFAMYLSHAQNLVEGRAYAETGYLYDAGLHCFSPGAYPPGFPLLLAPGVAIFGPTVGPALFVVRLCLFLWGLCLFLFLERFSGMRVAVLATLCIWYNPWVLEFSQQILSDLPFAFLLLAAVMLLASRSRYAVWALAIILPLMVLTRSVGWALPMAMTGFFFLAMVAKRMQTVKLEMPPLSWMVLVCWTVAVAVFSKLFVVRSKQGSYLSDLRPESLPADVAAHLDYYLDKTFDFFPAIKALDAPGQLLGCVAVTFILVGAVRRLRTPACWDFMVLIYLMVVLIWPCYQGFRFLAPLLPFLFYYLIEGFGIFRKNGLPATVFFSLLLLCSIPGALSLPENDGGPYSPAAQEMFEAVKTQLPEEARVDFFKPRVMALLGERDSHYLQMGNLADTDAIVTQGAKPELGEPLWTNQQFQLYLLKETP